ncbi:MAG TPA: hypothetical protein PLM07_15075 [Candidatus Rifleibacterium sp.]|nr:hypothetical protein [Candidatus Rifleibacterium sp.]HPT47202.1 hypothetical protein [Candidatus Rifleibacterium sp.]
MIRRYEFRVTLCIVLSLLMLVDFTVFNPAPAFALDKKSVLIGAGVGVAAGAGIVLAAPAIGGAIAAAGGVAGVGTAVVGGVAAVSGGVIGAVAAFGGAIASALGAVGGFLVGIFTSPLFIPALILVGAAVAGYFLYKRYKAKKNASSPSGKDDVISGSEEIYVTPGDYEMSGGVVPAGDADPISVGDTITIGAGAGDAVSVSDDIPVVAPTTAAAATTPTETATTVSTSTSSESLKAAHDRYISAYQKYTTLVTNSGGAQPDEIKAALAEYRTAYNDYQNLRMSGSK